jgi:MFS family permease
VIVGRAVQAVGASAFTPAGVALMVAAFPPERLASAMGTWAIAGGVASAAGPGLGGIVIDGLGWRWAFWLVVPLALAVLVAGPRVLHEAARPETDRRLPDLVGAALIMAAATAITLALVKGPSWGWLDRRTLLAAAVGVAGVAVVLVRSAHHPSPIIELGLFRLRTVQLGNAGTFTFSFSWFGMFFGLVLFLDQSWGWSLLEAGLASAPVPLLAGLCGVWVGRRADVAGHRRYVVPGALVYGAAAAWFALFLDDEPNLFVLLVGIVAIGVASGMVFPSMQAVALYGVPPDRHGMASAIMFTIQRLSITFGVALVLGLLGTTTSVTPIVWVMFVGAVAAGLIGAAVDTRPRP